MKRPSYTSPGGPLPTRRPHGPRRSAKPGGTTVGSAISKASTASPKLPNPPAKPPSIYTPNLDDMTEEKHYGQFEPAGGGSGPTGSAQVVMIILILLMVLVTWQQVVVPLASVAWNPGSKASITNVPWKGVLGMIVMIAIMTFIASISDAMAALMTVIAVGMVIVYMVETNGGGATAFFNWISGSQQPVTGGNTKKS